MHSILSLDEYNKKVAENEAALFYFSHEMCSVCHVLKPKVEAMISEQFPNMKTYYVQIDKQAEIAAQNRIFTAPTLLIYFNGKESYRYSRNIGINVLRDDIMRPYNMIFN